MDEDYIVRAYNEGYSTTELAKKFNTYPNKIRRILKKNGVQMRDKSDAQANALKNGVKHPTKGKKRTKAEKKKIAEGVAQAWITMPEYLKQDRAEIARERFLNLSDTDRREMQLRAGEALRATAKAGSKAELYLEEVLTSMGHSCILHKTGLIEKQKSHVDIYLPELLIAIEIDGPQHRRPVFGEVHLRNYIVNDMQKDGLLLAKGISVLRVIYEAKKFNNDVKKQLVDVVVDALPKFTIGVPELIEVEVSNGKT